MLIDVVYHSTLGLRVINREREGTSEIAKNARAVRAVVDGTERPAEVQHGLQTCRAEG